jgi:hypothetical protein
VPAPQRTARIEDDIWDPAKVRAKAEGASLGALMRAAVQRYASGELTSAAEPASQAAAKVTSQPASVGQPVSCQGTAAAIASIGPGEPSPGAACAGPGCWQRNTSRTACAACPCAPPAAQPSRARTTSARSPSPRHGPSAAAEPDL